MSVFPLFADPVQVREETWGHLNPKKGQIYKGRFMFCVGGYQCVNRQLCDTSFEDTGCSPDLYEDVSDFIHSLETKQWVDGLYQWEGNYRKYKNGNCAFQKGKIKLLHKFY
jgi:hypothetical protein